MTDEVHTATPLPAELATFLAEVRSAGITVAGWWIVGGVVRDALLYGAKAGDASDLDIATLDDPREFIPDLVAKVTGVTLIAEHRFGTATIDFAGTHIDFAMLRTETYVHPGALPEVEPTDSIEQDLLRRDITVNALAVPLDDIQDGFEAADVVDVHGGIVDLAGRFVRILHPGSFEDDPTRIIRVARYAGRLGFEIEASTRSAADLAIAKGALTTLSPERLAAELRLACEEPRAEAVFAELHELGILGDLIARPDLAQLSAAAPAPWTVSAAILGQAAGEEFVALMLPGATSQDLASIEWAMKSLEYLSTVFGPLDADLLLELDRHLADGPEADLQALARAVGGDVPEMIERYLERRSTAKPLLNGTDLLALDIPPGQLIGQVLSLLRGARLIGELETIEDERRYVEMLHRAGW